MAKRKRSVHGARSVYQRKGDGRWVAKFKVEETGRWKELYARTEKEAMAKLQQALYEQKQGTLVTASQQSLQAHMEHWLQIKRLELKDDTYNYYRVYTETYILPSLGHIRLQKLTVAQIQSFYADLLKELSANTVRIIHGILRGALDAAVRSRKIASNPCKLVTPPSAVEKELAYLTLEQAERLLETARNHTLECLLTLAIATRLRQGELLALRWPDIDFSKATLLVARSLSYCNPAGSGYGHKVEGPKTARTIPLPDFALEALQKHRAGQLEMRLKAPEWDGKGLVFPNDTGGYLWVDLLRRQLKQLLQEAGLPSLRFHALQRSAATILLAMGSMGK